MKRIIKIYKDEYLEYFQDNIKNINDKDMRDLLLNLLECNRSDEKHPNINICKEKAEQLYNEDDKKPLFIKIFSESSSNELKYIAQYYNKISNTNLINAIKSNFENDAYNLYLTVLYGVINPAEYFADKIKEAIENNNLNNDYLIRTIRYRRDIDLSKILRLYKNDKELIEEIENITSGDYKNILIEIIKTCK